MNEEPGSFVDPGGLLAVWAKDYLDTYLCSGGSTVKWLSGREGSGKSALMAQLRVNARARGYLVAEVGADTTPMGRFDEFYRAVAGQLMPTGLGQMVASQVARELGMAQGWDADGAVSLAEHLSGQGIPAEAVRGEFLRALGFLYRQKNIDPPVATALQRMAEPYLEPSDEAREVAEICSTWLLGRPVSASERKRAGIGVALDRYGARDVFRSLLFAVRSCGGPGIVVTVDRVEALLGGDGTLKYTRLRRNDAYEGIRELIDEGDRLPGLFVVYAGRPEVFRDERAGLSSYPALAMRVVNEVEANRPNLWNDLQDLDQIWRRDWPRYYEELCEVYGRGGRPDVSHLPSIWNQGVVSPVKLLVEALAGGRGGRGHGA